MIESAKKRPFFRLKFFKLSIAIFSLIMCFIGCKALAFVSSSNSFRLQYDSMNSGGGLSNSENFGLKDSLGEPASGISASDNFKVKAGFFHLGESNISISSPADFSFSSALGGISGGTTDGTISWNVMTDNPGGYTLSARSATEPALKSGEYSVSDFSPVEVNTPDFEWSIDQDDAEFGFSPEGSDVVLKFKDDGFGTCGTGSQNSTNKCWYNFKTSNETVSQSSSNNNPSGSTTELKLKAQVGNSRFQPEGNYTAQIIVTAMMN